LHVLLLMMERSNHRLVMLAAVRIACGIACTGSEGK
jgi:hypothetical protein